MYIINDESRQRQAEIKEENRAKRYVRVREKETETETETEEETETEAEKKTLMQWALALVDLQMTVWPPQSLTHSLPPSLTHTHLVGARELARKQRQSRNKVAPSADPESNIDKDDVEPKERAYKVSLTP